MNKLNEVEQCIEDPIDSNADAYLNNDFNSSEIIIGLVGAAGADFALVSELVETRLKLYGYSVEKIRISTDILGEMMEVEEGSNHYERVISFMNAGDYAREKSGDNGIIALGVASHISKRRLELNSSQITKSGWPKRAWIINSLKNPTEVERLKQIYSSAFYLIGVYAEQEIRRFYLCNQRGVSEEQALEIFSRDYSEELMHGQSTRDTFHLSDFFCKLDGDDLALSHSLSRFLDLSFGCPTITPTFDEYAMFMAFASSLRSADLSRQVGATIAMNKEIIASGANDVPRFGGGQYWPEYNGSTHGISDVTGGRDYMLGYDTNKKEKEEIIESVLKLLPENMNISVESMRDRLRTSPIADLTEFGRMVHAEMDALMSCARNHFSAKAATLYCTTFPCHNCAKHIVSAGLKRVVFVEPYAKSKAADMHKDSIKVGLNDDTNYVIFEPFMGVGPRRFFDLFSIKMSSGYEVKRKTGDGKVVHWEPETMARLRVQLFPGSFLDIEQIAIDRFENAIRIPIDAE